MQFLCFLQPLDIQHRKRHDDEEHHTDIAFELAPLIRTDVHENALLIVQGISYISSAA